MKNPNYLIQIAEPCHENWNAMTPEAKGKFCNSCSKTVIDFSNKTDLEIHTILMEKQQEKVCGHFRTSQVNRPLNLKLNLNDLPENMSLTRRFAFVLLMVFGTVLFTFTDLKGQQIQHVQVEDTETVVFMKGKIARSEIKEDTIPSQPDTLVLEEIDNPIMGDVAYIPEEPIDSVLKIPVNEECQLNPDSTETEYKFINGDVGLNTPETITDMEPELTVFPNPSRDNFSIRYELLEPCDVYIQLLDEKGMPLQTLVDMKQQYNGKYQIPINTSDLPNGAYMISGVIDKKRYTQRVIVEK